MVVALNQETCTNKYQSPVDNETSINDKIFVVGSVLINSSYSLNVKLQHGNFTPIKIERMSDEAPQSPKPLCLTLFHIV